MHLKLVLLEVCSSQYIFIFNNYEVSPHEYNSLDAIKANFNMHKQFVRWLFKYLCLVYIKSKFKALKSKFKKSGSVLQHDLCYS